MNWTWFVTSFCSLPHFVGSKQIKFKKLSHLNFCFLPWTTLKFVEVCGDSSVCKHHFVKHKLAKICDGLQFLSWFVPILNQFSLARLSSRGVFSSQGCNNMLLWEPRFLTFDLWKITSWVNILSCDLLCIMHKSPKIKFEQLSGRCHFTLLTTWLPQEAICWFDFRCFHLCHHSWNVPILLNSLIVLECLLRQHLLTSLLFFCSILRLSSRRLLHNMWCT